MRSTVKEETVADSAPNWQLVVVSFPEELPATLKNPVRVA